MSFSNYLEEKLMNYPLCNGDFAKPTVYLGLSSVSVLQLWLIQTAIG